MVKKSVAALAALASLAATDAFMAPATVGVAPRRATLAVAPQRRAISLRGGATQAQMASFYDFELPLVGEWLSTARLSVCMGLCFRAYMLSRRAARRESRHGGRCHFKSLGFLSASTADSCVSSISAQGQ